MNRYQVVVSSKSASLMRIAEDGYCQMLSLVVFAKSSRAAANAAKEMAARRIGRRGIDYKKDITVVSVVKEGKLTIAEAAALSRDAFHRRSKKVNMKCGAKKMMLGILHAMESEIKENIRDGQDANYSYYAGQRETIKAMQIAIKDDIPDGVCSRNR